MPPADRDGDRPIGRSPSQNLHARASDFRLFIADEARFLAAIDRHVGPTSSSVTLPRPMDAGSFTYKRFRSPAAIHEHSQLESVVMGSTRRIDL